MYSLFLRALSEINGLYDNIMYRALISVNALEIIKNNPARKGVVTEI